jgi:signal recognition particle subunit SEC65
MLSIYTLKNQIEAQVIESALREAGIKCIIRTFSDAAYNGIFIPQQGYGQVLVEDQDKEKAKEVIEDIQAED